MSNADDLMTNPEQNISIPKEQFLEACYLRLLKRQPLEGEIENWITNLDSSTNIFDVIEQFLLSEEFKNCQLAQQLNLQSFLTVGLLGEDCSFHPSEVVYWYQKVAQELAIKNTFFSTQLSIKKSSKLNLLSLPLFRPNKQFEVTIITSLYKGRKYIKSFLENIVNQTIFEKCQILIIDANSPENEYEIIKKFIKKYSNITYKRLDKTISIYEAWNLAIENSESDFITNANVDDALRQDALEMKVKALKAYPEVDVVYGDVYYSFIANLPFEVVEKGGLKTELPTANKENLLQFNSPHNSPMWRRSLHDKIGTFDSMYKSAGDYEFWLRAVFSGVKFFKIQQPLSVYYYNPDGLSTRKDTPSIIEEKRIVRKYQSLLELEKEQLQPTLQEVTLQLQEKQKQLEAAQMALLEIKSSSVWKLYSAWFKFKPLFFPVLTLIVGLSLLVITNFSNTKLF